MSSAREDDKGGNYSKTGNGLVSCTEANSSKKALGNEFSEGCGGSMNDKREKSIDKNYMGLGRENGFGYKPHIDVNGLASSMTASKEVTTPSFEFYVSSGDGINLFVDMDSSLSDWMKKLEDGVCLCQKPHNNNWRSFRQELANLKDCNNNKQIIKGSIPCFTHSDHDFGIGHVQPSSVSIKNQRVGFGPTDEGDDGSALLFSSVTNSGLRNQIISGGKSCLRDGETVTTESDVFNMPNGDSACDSLLKSTPYGEKVTDVVEHQDMKVEHSELANSSKVNQESCGPNITGEEWERNNTAMETESSECSQFANSSEMNCLRNTDPESNYGIQRKRQNKDGKMLPRRSMRRVDKSK